MDNLWGNFLWKQLGAAIDTLDKVALACPDALWTEHLWSIPASSDFPPQFSAFWYISYHATFWLDLYLVGCPEEEFAPPAPFAQGEMDSDETQPERPYTKAEVRGYLAVVRQKCHDTLMALTDEQAQRQVEYPWTEGQPVSYLELQLYNMRHVQEHSAQLSLFLGQHEIPNADEALDWVTRAKDAPVGA